MMRLALSALLTVIMTSAALAADAPAQPATAATAATPAAMSAAGATSSAAPPAAPLVQPDKILGNWKLTPQPLPPLEETVKKTGYGLPVYGLYIWGGDYVKFHDGISKVGWRSFRVGENLDDAAMKAIVADGVEVMCTLGLRIHKGEKKNRADYPTDAAFLTDYLKGVDAFLTRYGPGGTFFKDHATLPNRPIMQVEIWNEPNFQYMIPDREPRAEVEAAREALYAQVLPAAYELIKNKWPTVTVLGFGAGGASKGDLRFIQHVLEKDPRVARSFDVLSTHPYQPPTPPEADSVRSWGSFSVANTLKEIRDLLAKHGAAGKPIWYTECGWPISKEDGGEFKMDDKVTVPPLLQAAYICRMYALAMRLGVDRVHIMYVGDADQYNAGFFTNDLKWRPSAHAVRNMIRLLPNPEITRAISDGTDGYYAYAIDPQRNAKRQVTLPVIMAWNVAGPKQVELPWRAGTAVVVDMFGQTKEVAGRESKRNQEWLLTVDIGPCPVYVIAK